MLISAIAAGFMVAAPQGSAAEGVPAPAPLVYADVSAGMLDTAPAGAAPTLAQDDAAGPQESAPQDSDTQDIVVTGDSRPPAGDPLEKLNEQSFRAVQSVDRAVVEPIATAYNKGLPRPVRKGLRNFFSNLGEPVVFAAYILQFKPGKAMETAGRFTINSTLGVGGLFDVAKRKPFHLPYRSNGLANVLGYYGVGPGPYMYLPIVGPTTLRDIVGDTVDKLILPAAVGKPFNRPAYVIPATILNQLGERAAFDETIQRIRDEDDPYATYRALYLQQRQAEIDALHGRATTQPLAPVYGPAMGKKALPEGALIGSDDMPADEAQPQ